jgi:hypothetical protein
MLTAGIALPIWIVMILTGGQWCLMPGAVSAHVVVSSAGGAGHAERDAHAAHSTALSPSQHAGDVAHDRAQGDSHHHAPAEQQDHASRGCESQAACSVAIAPAEVPVATASVASRGEPTVLRPEHPASRSLAPELPPPRA